MHEQAEHKHENKNNSTTDHSEKAIVEANSDGKNDQTKPEPVYYIGEMPPGYRFVPLDEELIRYYLKKKVSNEPLPYSKIPDVNLYKHNPQALAEMYEPFGDDEWFFFTPRDRKYRNGTRPNRAAGTGYWKATGADKPISYKGEFIGSRKALVFYEGKPPKGDKSNWIMHEYRVDQPPRSRRNANDMRLDDWVLCRVYKKADRIFRTGQVRRRADFEEFLHDEENNEILDVRNEVEDREKDNDNATLANQFENPVHKFGEYFSTQYPMLTGNTCPQFQPAPFFNAEATAFPPPQPIPPIQPQTQPELEPLSHPAKRLKTESSNHSGGIQHEDFKLAMPKGIFLDDVWGNGFSFPPTGHDNMDPCLNLDVDFSDPSLNNPSIHDIFSDNGGLLPKTANSIE